MFRRILISLLVPCFLATAVAEEPAAAPVKAGGFEFKASSPWKARPQPRMMSAGGYTLKAADAKDPVEMDFYHFGQGQGGGVEANIARWRSQFQADADGKLPEITREEVELGGKKVVFVKAAGTFLSGAPMAREKTPKPGFAMIGAIIPGDSGDVFVKVTGPEEAVKKAEGDVRAIIETACRAGK